MLLRKPDLWLLCCLSVSVNLHISVCSTRAPPLPSDLWLSTVRGGASATPAKVADASLCTDEECLMRKGWDPDKFTQGGRRKELLLQSALVHYGGRYLLPFKLLPQ